MLKHKSYSVIDKLAVIASIKCSESQANMSSDNGVPESTIHRWLRDEYKLCDFIDWMKRKKSQNCQRPQLDKVGRNPPRLDAQF